MTTLHESPPRPDYQGVEDIQAVLDGVHNRRWMVGVVRALLLAGAIAAGGLLLAALCGYWPDQPPATLRWGLFVLLMIVFITALGLLTRALLQRANLAQTARFVETHLPGLRNGLINSVLLSRDADQPSPALVQCAIRETLLRVGSADVRRCVSLKPLRNAALPAVVVGAALAAFLLLQPGAFRRGLGAVLRPTAYVPADNTLQLLSLTPGDAAVFASSPLTIRLAVRADAAEDIQAEVVVEGDEAPKIMHPSAGRSNQAVLEYRVQAVHEPLRYFVRAHGTERQGRWPADREWFRVAVSTLEVQAVRVRYEYPEYTHLPERDVTLSAADAGLVAPLGSWATLSVRVNQPVARCVIEFDAERREDMLRRDEGNTFRTRLAVHNDGGYRLRFLNEDGRELLRLPDGRAEEFYPIHATPDAPPRIAVVQPGRDVTVPVGGSLPIRVEASDDFGLAEVQLLAGKQGMEPKPLPALQMKPDGKTKLSHSLRWPMTEYADGDVIVYHAVATDSRRLGILGGPQTTTTPTYQVRIQNPAQAQADRTGRLSDLQRRLLDLLERQTKLRAATAILPSPYQVSAEWPQTCRSVFDGQKRIHTGLEDLSKNFPFEPEMDDLRNAVTSLTANEAKLAVEQAQPLSAVTTRDPLATLCGPLLQTQDAILTTLREMLAVLPAQARRLQNVDPNLGQDLTADERREKREKLIDAMKQFIADQKKIIDASGRLNKKTPDDFTADDQKQLDELIALQDQWEKFLNEAFADFSKLAQQDFANPSLLKELLSIQADVTMARDALKNKAVEIATALESNGIENAESLTANIEKWLPDKPDREKWAMEAPEEQDNIEQAELPTELEDLMGELLEEEEDLFEEMDDVSSKATISGDKAIGWDAIDGPISNMNAQGVTGNQLPNTSEIQGRSGEGRSGKSGGEYVEDKAVGKGGRRTPTRLSDDPFQQGNINDASAEPAGGATGGGKVSGAGTEGLEGPTPASVARQLQRLAGRQASIVNRAERGAARLKIGDYSAFRMDQAVLLMNRVKGDLESGDYQNALRRRASVLTAIRRTRGRLAGGIEIERDSSRTPPKDQLDEITDAAQRPQPKEYREALQQYYQRLSETAKP